MIIQVDKKKFNKYLCSIFFLFPYSFSYADKPAAPVIFDSSPLRGTIDVSQFTYSNSLTEGTHRVEIYLNDEWKGKADVYFKKINNDRVTMPCYTMKLIEQIGISTETLDENKKIV